MAGQPLVEALVRRQLETPRPEPDVVVAGADGAEATPLELPMPCFGIRASFHPKSDSGAAPVHDALEWGISGWRVFAERQFMAGEVVEQCELLPVNYRSGVDTGVSARYLLRQGQGSAKTRMPLGFCLFYRRTRVGGHGGGARAPLLAAWSDDGAAVVLSASVAVEVGEELLLDSDIAAVLQRRLGGLSSGPPPGRGTDLDEDDLDEIFCNLVCGRDTSETKLAPAVADRPDVFASTRQGVCPGKSPIHGRGVFALQDFAKGDIVQLCPALVLDGPTAEGLESYCMNFRVAPTDPAAGEAYPVAVLSLGIGSLFNHSVDPSINWNYVPGLCGGGVVAMLSLIHI